MKCQLFILTCLICLISVGRGSAQASVPCPPGLISISQAAANKAAENARELEARKAKENVLEAALVEKDKIADATRIAAMITTPQAVWFTDGTPTQVKKAVKKTTTAAKGEKRVPVLVAYNLPYRDCAQYSAGGAVDTAAYQAWIDAFAEGIGSREAIVILEPDGLGIIPYNVTFWNAQPLRPRPMTPR